MSLCYLPSLLQLILYLSDDDRGDLVLSLIQDLVAFLHPFSSCSLCKLMFFTLREEPFSKNFLFLTLAAHICWLQPHHYQNALCA